MEMAEEANGGRGGASKKKKRKVVLIDALNVHRHLVMYFLRAVCKG